MNESVYAAWHKATAVTAFTRFIISTEGKIVVVTLYTKVEREEDGLGP